MAKQDAAALEGTGIAAIISPPPKDIGGFEVKRVIPAPGHRAVGPFVFFDHIGPADFAPGEGINVRPHPHIGLATITYLLEGEFRHRDSLGTDQMIYPGEVNWMIAGKGITHSERTSEKTKAAGHRLFGLQTWIALPKAHEETPPAFEHVKAHQLPHMSAEGVALRMIIGDGFGLSAPVKTFSPMHYADVQLERGAQFAYPPDLGERAIHVMEGTLSVDGVPVEPSQMAILKGDATVSIVADSGPVRFVVLGGAPLDGPRILSWNFVASSQEKIDAAAAAWRSENFTTGRFSLPPGDDQEFIPLA